MLSALSTGHKSGILIVAGIFIVFALCSALLFPKLRENYPGKRLGLFIGVSVLLTVGMLATILVLAKEPPEAGAKVESRNPVLPETTSTETAPPAQTAAGDAAAGKALFASQGCSSCHTYAPAGSTGAVGPDLDKLPADATTANRGSLAAYVTESIKDPGAYVVPGYPNGVMPQFQLSDQQVADLVAFLTTPQG